MVLNRSGTSMHHTCWLRGRRPVPDVEVEHQAARCRLWNLAKRARHWAKNQLINLPKWKKTDGSPIPLSLLVEPLELASDAVENIPNETRTKKAQQKNERQDKDGWNSDIRKLPGKRWSDTGQWKWAKSQISESQFLCKKGVAFLKHCPGGHPPLLPGDWPPSGSRWRPGLDPRCSGTPGSLPEITDGYCSSWFVILRKINMWMLRYKCNRSLLKWTSEGKDWKSALSVNWHGSDIHC